jgi:type IV pilus assembly protein PilV
MIEVLVTVVILAIGLLGVAGMQSRLQLTDMESYQRAQAVLLLEDMANRVAVNRAHAANYATTAPLGVGMSCPTATGTRQQIDALQWCNSLQGAAETFDGSNAGAMIGARGCVEQISSTEYLITVAWQGLTPLSAPEGVSCGQDLYNGASDSGCTGDRCRRVATTKVGIATLN